MRHEYSSCLCFVGIVLLQAEEDRKIVLARRFNEELQQGMHESLKDWKKAEDLE